MWAPVQDHHQQQQQQREQQQREQQQREQQQQQAVLVARPLEHYCSSSNQQLKLEQVLVQVVGALVLVRVRVVVELALVPVLEQVVVPRVRRLLTMLHLHCYCSSPKQ